RDFLAYDASFTGGVRVALGDVNADGKIDLITATGTGGGSDIKIFDGQSGNLLREFAAYDATFGGGVNVAVGDVNGDGRADIITGADVGGGPHIKVFDGVTGNLLQSYFAFAADNNSGVRVAAADVNGDGKADVIVGAASGVAHVKVFDGLSGAEVRSFDAYATTF